MIKKSIKSFLKKIIPPAIWDYIRYIKFKVFKFSNFAPYYIDKKLEKYLDYKYGYFVELGANDGITEFNTLYLDVQGLELAVLKGIDFDKYKFKYMLIECRNFRVVQKFLKKYGYNKINKLTHHDYLFTCE